MYDRQDSESAVDFLKYCRQVFPFAITTVLTDNGKCFTDRFARGRQTPSGKHVFDKTCTELGIEHRLIQTYTPRTNGMVERMNGRFNEHVLDRYMFASVDELEAKLMEYTYHCNYYIKQKSLGYLSPMEYYHRLVVGDNPVTSKSFPPQEILHNHPELDNVFVVNP